MEVTGYQLRESLDRWRLKRDIAEKQFKESLLVFEGDDKLSPEQVMKDFREADYNIARLQTAQQQFNLEVTVTLVDGTTMPLAMAVKLVGGAGRMSKQWRMATTDEGSSSDRYYSRDNSRDNSKEYAKRSISVREAARLADEAARYRSSIAAAIAYGNSRKMEVNLPADLFA